MFVGGSAGSTTGSIKVVRHLLVGKVLRRELGQTVSPELVMPIRLNGRRSTSERSARSPRSSSSTSEFWVVGAGVIAIDSAIGDAGLGAARLADRVGERARERRSRVRDRPARSASFAPLGRRLQGHDDRPHVARAAGDHPRRRALHAALLAVVTPGEASLVLARRGAPSAAPGPSRPRRPRAPGRPAA